MAAGGTSGKRSGKLSPASQRAEYDRQHGITADMRRRVTTSGVIGSVVLLVVTIVACGLFAPHLGLQPSSETYGAGTVRVDSCAPISIGMYSCEGDVSSWDSGNRSRGDAVSVVSRTQLSGTVDVVARDSTGSVLDKDGYRFTTHAEWIMPADQGVLSPEARVGVILAALAVWIVASWGFSRLVVAVAVRRASRASAT